MCLVSYEFPPFIIGGAGTYAGLLYEGLRDKGINVSVICRGEKNEFGSIVRLNTPNIKYWRRFYFTYYAAEALRKLYNEKKIDIIHYNEPHIILSKHNIPAVSTFHSTQINEFLIKLRLSKLISSENIIETLIKSPVGSIGDVLSSRMSDKIICPNDHLKYMINKYCFYNMDDIRVINNGININVDGDKILEEICFNGNVIRKNEYILYVGRLDPIKGIEYLINAFKVLRKKHDVKLVIVGTGFYEPYLKKISDNYDMIFTGHISDKSVLSNLYKNSLMVILPSLYEALPMVLLEAMSYGKPVIATRVGGIPDVLTDGENGLLVDPKNHIQLYAGMKYLIENEDVALKIGLTNVKHIKYNYSLDKMLDETIDLYEDLIIK